MSEGVVMRGKNDENGVREWQDGLPDTKDLTPLSQALLSPELASAFSITPEPCRTMFDVNRASQNTLSNLRKQHKAFSLSANLPSFLEDSIVEQSDEYGGSEKRKPEEEETQEENSALQTDDDHYARALKRARLAWTPQLHKRFVDVVARLGIKSAVPKTIMQLMNVEGLTRENVASHLQKYRLYLKRMDGTSNEGPSPSDQDQLFASTPVPPSLKDLSGAAPAMPIPMPYGHPTMPVPGFGHMGMTGGNPPIAACHAFDAHHYNMYREQQRDWSGNRFGSIASHHHVSSNTK